MAESIDDISSRVREVLEAVLEEERRTADENQQKETTRQLREVEDLGRAGVEPARHAVECPKLTAAERQGHCQHERSKPRAYCASLEDALEQIRKRGDANTVKETVRKLVQERLRADVPSWDDYFHAMAQTAAMRSKDPNKQVGAVIVSADDVVLSTGFNGFPRGIKELPERWHEKSEKLRWVAHAEANAIFNAARLGVSVEGGTIYTTCFPCTHCAQAIVQAGLRRVFTRGDYWEGDPNQYQNAEEIFAEARDVVVDAPKIRVGNNELRDLRRRFERSDLDFVAEVTRLLVAKLSSRQVQGKAPLITPAPAPPADVPNPTILKAGAGRKREQPTTEGGRRIAAKKRKTQDPRSPKRGGPGRGNRKKRR